MRFIKPDYNSVNRFIDFSLNILDQNLSSLEYVHDNIKTVVFHPIKGKEDEKFESVLRIKKCSKKIEDLVKAVKKELKMLSEECLRKELVNIFQDPSIFTKEHTQSSHAYDKFQSQTNEADKRIESKCRKWLCALNELSKDIVKLNKIIDFTQREKVLIDECYDTIYNIEKILESLKINADNHKKKIDQIPNISHQIDEIKRNINNIPIKIRESLREEELRCFNKLSGSNSVELIDNLWDLIIKKIKDLGIVYWEDKKLLESLKVEMILELLNSVSVFTSPLLRGADTFFKFIEFYDNNLVYENKNSSKCLDRWKIKYDIKKECIITKKSFNTTKIRGKRADFTTISHIKFCNFKRNPNFKIIKVLNFSQEHNNLISNYVQSHMIIENDLDKRRETDEIKSAKAKERKEQINYRLFLKHGSHLLGILLRASEELKLPFSTRCPGAYTLGGLKKLQERIDIACQIEIAAKEIENWEKLSMKYNAESIYHLSYLAKAYENIKSLDLTSSYRIFSISKYLLHMDSLVLSNHYIGEFNNVKSKERDELKYEKELIYVQFLVLPLIKDLFYYYLYQVSQCEILSVSNNNVNEEQLIDYICAEPHYTLNDIQRRREEYNRLFLLCSRYINDNYDFNFLNNYFSTTFGEIDLQYEIHEVNLTSLLRNSYDLPQLWFGDCKMRLEYLEALVYTNEDCLKKIDEKIEESIINIKGLQLVNSQFGLQNFPFTDEYNRFQRQKLL